MRILLDTHIWLWWALDPGKISARTRDLMSDKQNKILFSAAGVWEIAIKYRLGKLKLPMPPAVYVPTRLTAQGFQLLPINASHAAEVGLLPDHHRDPFDRLLIAQAQIEGLTLLTTDHAMKPYAVNTIFME